jgi:hypothetical protein
MERTISEDAIEAAAKAIYGGDDWDAVWQENEQFSETLHDEYRSKARRAVVAYMEHVGG